MSLTVAASSRTRSGSSHTPHSVGERTKYSTAKQRHVLYRPCMETQADDGSSLRPHVLARILKDYIRIKRALQL